MKLTIKDIRDSLASYPDDMPVIMLGVDSGGYDCCFCNEKKSLLVKQTTDNFKRTFVTIAATESTGYRAEENRKALEKQISELSYSDGNGY